MAKAAALLLTLLLGGCTLDLSRIQDPARSVAVTTTAPWNSMMYPARIDSGVVMIDLGGAGGEGKLGEGLTRLGAPPEDVGHVFLPHPPESHRRLAVAPVCTLPPCSSRGGAVLGLAAPW